MNQNELINKIKEIIIGNSLDMGSYYQLGEEEIDKISKDVFAFIAMNKTQGGKNDIPTLKQ